MKEGTDVREKKMFLGIHRLRARRYSGTSRKGRKVREKGVDLGPACRAYILVHGHLDELRDCSVPPSELVKEPHPQDVRRIKQFLCVGSHSRAQYTGSGQRNVPLFTGFLV